MALSTQAKKAIAKLTNHLTASTGPINVKLGHGLFLEMQKEGLLPVRPFGNPAFPSLPIEHFSFQQAFVIYEPDLGSYDFIIGDGAMLLG